MNRLVKQGFPSAPDRPVRPGADGWTTAVLLVERWLAAGTRADTLLEGLAPGLAGPDRARAQHLFYGVVRWHGRLDGALAGLMARPPRTKVVGILLVAGFEILEGGAETAQVVHHAVEKAKTVASLKEAGLVNAVARKLAARLAEKPAAAADEFSHPTWLVARWEKQFGPDAIRQLLAWNQAPAPVHMRWRRPDVPAPEFFKPTKWAGFFEVPGGQWDEVRRLAADGALYVQDPSTRLSIELLAPQANETILDACAAPGGKSLFIADLMQTGRLVALDEEGPRLDRLKENLNRAPSGVQVALQPADLRKAGTKFSRDFTLPESYDAVLLDAPCSNTGVMRHRVDVKWRLQEGDFAQHAAQQFAFLKAAARLVAPGGRLVYSTCSIDPEENEQVVQRFTREVRGWTLERHVQAYPWVDGHDGAAAFLLRKVQGSSHRAILSPVSLSING